MLSIFHPSWISYNPHFEEYIVANNLNIFAHNEYEHHSNTHTHYGQYYYFRLVVIFCVSRMNTCKNTLPTSHVVLICALTVWRSGNMTGAGVYMLTHSKFHVLYVAFILVRNSPDVYLRIFFSFFSNCGNLGLDLLVIKSGSVIIYPVASWAEVIKIKL